MTIQKVIALLIINTIGCIIMALGLKLSNTFMFWFGFGFYQIIYVIFFIVAICEIRRRKVRKNRNVICRTFRNKRRKFNATNK